MGALQSYPHSLPRENPLYSEQPGWGWEQRASTRPKIGPLSGVDRDSGEAALECALRGAGFLPQESEKGRRHRWGTEAPTLPWPPGGLSMKRKQLPGWSRESVSELTSILGTSPCRLLITKSPFSENLLCARCWPAQYMCISSFHLPTAERLLGCHTEAGHMRIVMGCGPTACLSGAPWSRCPAHLGTWSTGLAPSRSRAATASRRNFDQRWPRSVLHTPPAPDRKAE